MKETFSRKRALLNLLLIAALSIQMTGFSLNTAASACQKFDHSNDQSWSFGIISDTQWTKNDDGYNPNTVAANIIKQVNGQFIKAGVKFVVALGDTVDIGDKKNIDTRALYAQDLYNAGIGFYPLRGNHEATEGADYLTSGIEFQHAFPQISAGINNNTPSDITTAIIPAADLANNPPATPKGFKFRVGTDFTAPTDVNSANNSISYAFRYRNATFMLLDQFNVNGEYYPSTVPQQQGWIDRTLSGRPDNTHAFVFAHKNLLGGNHKDNLFGAPVAGSDPGDGNGVNAASLTADQQTTLAAKQADMNSFIASMQANLVDVFISGHDHHHYASVVTSPDGKSKVNQLIAQSDSSKFYTPVAPISANDMPIQQDLGRIGYYIVSIDGPLVKLDYYGDTTGGGYYGASGGAFTFTKMQTLFYTLNGQETIVPQTGSYVMTDEAPSWYFHKGTSMSILAGTNSNTGKTNYGKALSNAVITAWDGSLPTMASDTLQIRIVSDKLEDATDPYVLSMTYTGCGATNSSLIKKGKFGLLTKDSHGNWVKAGASNYIAGPWKSGYSLGTYGVDPATHTAWAVINFDGDFAVGRIYQ